MRPSVPSYTDWVWFGKQSEEELTQFISEEKNKKYLWFQGAYRWFYDRRKAAQTLDDLPEPSSERCVGPERGLVPVLAADGQIGCLGFLAVDTKLTFGSSIPNEEFDEICQNAYKMAKYIFDLFRQLDHELGDPLIEPRLSEGGGTSLSLAVIMASMSRILGIQWPQTLVSTGCFDAVTRKLVPVDSDSLTQKAETAIRFGYTTLVVVEGQILPNSFSKSTNLHDDSSGSDSSDHFNSCSDSSCSYHLNHSNHSIRIVFVHSDPVSAMLDLLYLADHQGENAAAIAYLLAVYSFKKVRDVSFSEIEAEMKPYRTSPLPLVQNVACDVCSRSALHQGMTQEAGKYRELERPLAWNEYPFGWLGHYLRYERVASWSVVAIDAGLWDDNEPGHLQLDKRIVHLQQAKKDGFADAADVFNLMTLLNTRALRYQYLGRMTKSPELLCFAWRDFYELHCDWKAIFYYCSIIKRGDSNWERQRNYCIGALFDAYQLGISLGELPGAKEFLQRFDKGDFNNENENFDRTCSYDLTAEILIDKILEKSFSEEEMQALFDDSIRVFKKNCIGYIPGELLLRFLWGNNTQRTTVLDKLINAWHLSPEGESSSILTLLALRTRAVLKQNGIELSYPPVLPPEGSPLRHWADFLLKSPETLIDRCPY